MLTRAQSHYGSSEGCCAYFQCMHRSEGRGLAFGVHSYRALVCVVMRNDLVPAFFTDATFCKNRLRIWVEDHYQDMILTKQRVEDEAGFNAMGLKVRHVDFEPSAFNLAEDILKHIEVIYMHLTDIPEYRVRVQVMDDISGVEATVSGIVMP